MLKNSTVKIILAVAVIILIVAATFAYGNSQRQAQDTTKQEASQTTSASPSAQSSSATPSPTTSSAPSASTSSPAQSASPTSTPTPQIAPPGGTTPATGGEIAYVLPFVGIGLLLFSRREGQKQLTARLKRTV